MKYELKLKSILPHIKLYVISNTNDMFITSICREHKALLISWPAVRLNNYSCVTFVYFKERIQNDTKQGTIQISTQSFIVVTSIMIELK